MLLILFGRGPLRRFLPLRRRRYLNRLRRSIRRFRRWRRNVSRELYNYGLIIYSRFLCIRRRRRFCLLTNFKNFGTTCKKVLRMKGTKSWLWQYGGAGDSGTSGKYDGNYYLMDVSASIDGDYNTNLWAYLAAEYHKFIINKVVINFSNFNILNRYQEDLGNSLDYGNTSSNYPFTNKKLYAYSRVAGTERYYVKYFRSTDSKDNIIPFSEVNSAFHKKLYPLGNSQGRRKALKFVYYPKCKKLIDLTLDNLPFGSNTLGSCIGKMDPKHINYFRIGIGYGPFSSVAGKDVKTEAYEVEVRCEATVTVHLSMLYRNVIDYGT